MSTRTACESYLQDLGDECHDVLGKLLDGDLHITDDNYAEWEAALSMMVKTFDMIRDLRRHKYPAPQHEHDDATQPVWARLVGAQ